MEFDSNDYYEYYKKHSKHSYKGKKIWKRHFKSILNHYYAAISKVIIYDMYSFYLSNRCGTMSIIKYKSDSTYYDADGNIKKNNLPVDWPETYKIWEEDYGKLPNSEYKKIKDKPLALLFNEHSDGWQVKWNWDRKSCMVKNQSGYYFKAMRDNKRRLAKAYKSMRHLDYEVNDIWKK